MNGCGGEKPVKNTQTSVKAHKQHAMRFEHFVVHS